MTVGYGWCFTVDAASYAVIACLVMMRPAELNQRSSKRTWTVREGFATFVRFRRSAFRSSCRRGQHARVRFNVTLPLFVTRGLRAGEIL